jgi:transcriptional regulator with XRE-family HTH domain
MDIAEVIKRRLEDLGREQRDLAMVAEVTESYISQLLTGKKAPPAPSRSDIYDKIETFLKLPAGKLAKLADIQRVEELKKKIDEPAGPLYQEIRELILKKCKPQKVKQLRSLFANEPFGEIERIITQKLLDVAKEVAKKEWKNENWLRGVACLNHTSYEEMRVIVLEFLDSDIFNLSAQNFIYFLDPLIESWDIDLTTFTMKIVLAPELGRERMKQFEFVEKEGEPATYESSALSEFLQNPVMSGDVTQEEIEFLKRLRFKSKRPTPLYYYRELQNLRDPLHFDANGGKQV